MVPVLSSKCMLLRPYLLFISVSHLFHPEAFVTSKITQGSPEFTDQNNTGQPAGIIKNNNTTMFFVCLLYF